MSRVIMFFVLFLVLSISCCDKKYEDFNEEDFYEVQGVVINSHRTSSPFDGINSRSVEYMYHFEKKIPLKGFESDIVDVRALIGSPIIVLVLKDNPEISFFGYGGIINEKELNMGFQYLINDDEFKKRAGLD